MYSHKINPRRTAQGHIPTFTPTNTGVAALYNNSTTHRLALWLANSNNDIASSPIGFYPLHGTLTTLVGPGTVIWTNQGAIDGLLYKDDLASPGTAVGGVWPQFAGGYFTPQIPIWILDPGWSIVFVGPAPANTVGVNMLWESLSVVAFPPYEDAYDGFGPDFSN